jgi:hypothetical protein
VRSRPDQARRWPPRPVRVSRTWRCSSADCSTRRDSASSSCSPGPLATAARRTPHSVGSSAAAMADRTGDCIESMARLSGPEGSAIPRAARHERPGGRLAGALLRRVGCCQARRRRSAPRLEGSQQSHRHRPSQVLRTNRLVHSTGWRSSCFGRVSPGRRSQTWPYAGGRRCVSSCGGCPRGNRTSATTLVGVASLLVVVTLRQARAGPDALVTGEVLVVLYDRMFLLGQSFIPALNALLLGSLLCQSRLVPRVLPLSDSSEGPCSSLPMPPCCSAWCNECPCCPRSRHSGSRCGGFAGCQPDRQRLQPSPVTAGMV